MKAAQLQRYLASAPRKNGWVALSEEIAQKLVQTLENYEGAVDAIYAALK
jgi:hypothetical protein